MTDDQSAYIGYITGTIIGMSSRRIKIFDQFVLAMYGESKERA